jgi:3'(2'), 5'-bisphosphate nucleotidase
MALTPDTLASLALAAGQEIMRIYRTDFSVEKKLDDSLLTEADGLAEAIILKGLAEAEPDLQVIAEESVAGGIIPEHGARFALVDPLDGTKEFVAKNGEFTVNIAIIEHGRPVMGVVYAPALHRLFVAESPSSAWQAKAAPDGPPPSKRNPLRIRPSAGGRACRGRLQVAPLARNGCLARQLQGQRNRCGRLITEVLPDCGR